MQIEGLAVGKGLFKEVDTDGLADIVIHAGCKALLAIALHGMGCHRDNTGPLAGSIQGTELTGGL